MAGPSATVTRANIVAGPAVIYAGIFGQVTIPADADVNVAPAASGGWRDMGGTDGALTVAVAQTFFTGRVQQVPDAVLRRLTERDVTAKVNLAEATLANFRAVTNESQAGSGQGSGYSKQILTAGTAAIFPVEQSIIVDGWAPGTNKRRRCILKRVTSIENVEEAVDKGGMRMYPVTFGSMFIDTNTSPYDVIDEP